ncbi:MAG: nucleotide exchange factor GrpE [Candidatus Limnocylindria bacterium]
MTDHPTNGGAKPQTRTRGEERADAIKTPTRAELAELIEQLERELEEVRAKSDEHLNNWQRSAADFANFRRRTDEDRGLQAQFSNAILIGKLLSVLDDFDRALENAPDEVPESWLEGVQLVERKLRGVLESEGVTAIEAEGQPFDPNLHEAVVHEDTKDHPDNQVIGEVQRGYRLHDRLIRPSLVRVANNPKEH